MELLRKLQHDHAPLAEGLHRLTHRASAQPLDGGRRTDLIETAEQLRDELMDHFADEEEALFPWVRRELPHYAEQLTALESSHDAICGALARVLHALGREEDGTVALGDLLGRLVSTYSSHTAAEIQLLESVAAELTPEQQAHLALASEGLL